MSKGAMFRVAAFARQQKAAHNSDFLPREADKQKLRGSFCRAERPRSGQQAKPSVKERSRPWRTDGGRQKTFFWLNTSAPNRNLRPCKQNRSPSSAAPVFWGSIRSGPLPSGAVV